MPIKSASATAESTASFSVNTPYQMETIKEFGKGYLTLIDTCCYVIDIVNCFSEGSFSNSVRSLCEGLAKRHPKSAFVCKARVTSKITGCSMYADVEYKGNYLSVLERSNGVCLNEKSPVCVDCGCSLKRVVNNRRFECPSCDIVYVSSEYLSEGFEESGCHLFCFPKSYRVRVG